MIKVNPSRLLPILLAASAILLTALHAPARAQSATQPLDRIVAVVNEEVILESELELAVDGITRRLQSRGAQMPPPDVLREQVLERLILTRLEVQRAQATGIRVSDADVDNALRDVAAQNNIGVEQLRRTLEADGYDFSEFRQELRDELLSSRLRQRIVDDMTQVTETEVDILLASEDLSGGEFHLSQIMIALPEGSNPAQIETAATEAQEVHQRLQDGLDFGAAAVSYSDAQDALEGGEIGWRDVNSIPTLFADAVQEVETGGITDPIRSPAGFHILKVNDRRSAGQVMVNETRARHIMVATTELVSAQDAMARIQDIKQDLDAGEDFEELAREHSDDITSANVGGDMGWFPQGVYGGAVDQALNSLEPGEISEPFQTQSGWHIVQLVGHREMDRTEQAGRTAAREKIRQRKADIELNQFLRQLRDESYVDIRLQS